MLKFISMINKFNHLTLAEVCKTHYISNTMFTLHISTVFYAASLLASAFLLRKYFALRVVALRNHHLR